jgi:hypothetical protein
MYGSTGMSGTVAAGAATLAATGVSSLWYVILAVTLVTVGTVLSQLVPRKEH